MNAVRRVAPFTLFCFVSVAMLAQSPARAPRIWDDEALADWATPIAALNLRPGHYSTTQYYSVPGDNLRTYPVYHPDREPQGYWEALQKKTPEPLVDVARITGAADWIVAGERAFAELDTFWSRTDDPALIREARNPRNFEGVYVRSDGTVGESRWVVTTEGVKLSRRECARCHRDVLSERDGGIAVGTERAALLQSASARLEPAGMGDPATLVRTVPRFFAGDTLPIAVWRTFTVPWAPDERIEQIRRLNTEQMSAQELRRLTQLGATPGSFPRVHGSPYHAAKIPDLRLLRYSRYLDATATHRLRGAEDVARYAAFITGTDPMDFGPHRILSDAQRVVRFRFADEVLYAIGMYLMSLEAPANPDVASASTLDRGAQLFRREGCANCHVPPAYTSGRLTLALDWQPPANHPNRADIVPISVGTDPGLSLKTRKGTGFYKIPSLRGVWYRPFLLHDGSLTRLEEMFDKTRLDPQYQPTGWNPPAVTTRAVAGHPFGMSLEAEEKSALLAFLRSL